MRAATIVQSVVGLTIAASGAAFAQGANPAVNVSSVVRGGVVVVSYDLVSTDPNATFSIALDASEDGGKTYAVRPQTIKGDVGAQVRPGTGKQITWEAVRDTENINVDRLRYRVTAQLIQPAQLATPPERPAQKGKGHLWGGLAMIGGGAFLAISSMTTMKNADYETNMPLMFAGLGLAGGGVAVAALGGGSSSSNGTAIVFRPGGVSVQHRMPVRMPF